MAVAAFPAPTGPMRRCHDCDTLGRLVRGLCWCCGGPNVRMVGGLMQPVGIRRQSANGPFTDAAHLDAALPPLEVR